MKNETVTVLPPQSPQVPAMPPQLAMGMPTVNLKPINVEANFIERALAKWASADISETTKHQRDAAENMLAIAKHTDEAMTLALTFSARVQMVFVRFEHEKTMFNFAERRAEKELEHLDHIGQKLQLENQILFYQSKEAEISVKTAELDFNARRQAMEQ